MIDSEPAILVLGIGNDILTDDGIGPKLVNDLNKSKFPKGVCFQSATLGGLELLELMKDYDEVVIIDALKTGQNLPGFVHYYTTDDFKETLHSSNLHDIDFLTALELGRQTGMQLPESIHIIAIEIVEDRVFSSSFSPAIIERYPAILEHVQDLLQYLVNTKL